MKIWCKLFGHKRPWLFTPDGMRCVCSRCGYASFTVKAVAKLLASDECKRMLRESCTLTSFTQFQKLKVLLD